MYTSYVARPSHLRIQMETIHQQLERAKSLYYDGKLVEAYPIFKRFFDRMPFKVEILHSEYIGMFCRTLVELGKKFDLKFYESLLDGIYSKDHNPYVGFGLLRLYLYSDKPRTALQMQMCEKLLRNDEVKDLHEKIKLILLHIYFQKGDYVSARQILTVVAPGSDIRLQRFVKISDAMLARRENRLEYALERVREVSKAVTFEEDWYSFFYASLIEAMSLANLGKRREAIVIYRQLVAISMYRRFKEVSKQLMSLEKQLGFNQGEQGVENKLLWNEKSTGRKLSGGRVYES